MGVTSYLTTDLASIRFDVDHSTRTALLAELHFGLCSLDGGVGSGRHDVASVSHCSPRAGGDDAAGFVHTFYGFLSI